MDFYKNCSYLAYYLLAIRSWERIISLATLLSFLITKRSGPMCNPCHECHEQLEGILIHTKVVGIFDFLELFPITRPIANASMRESTIKPDAA